MSKDESTTKEEEVSGSTTEATEETKTSKTEQLSKEDMLIEQVRNELESYFAPSNLQNDYVLRRKMTSDGYINIDYLLQLKLISELATDREVLVSALAQSKLLKMNTARTMVKYMPLLERKTLILRDIATSTKKEQIVKIFTDSAECCTPLEVHSDIGNNWFCSFETEEECLATAKYLQQFGTFMDKKLHVRVKAIHDVKKADALPSMSVPSGSSKKSKVEVSGAQQAPLYSPSGGYYGYSGYYGSNPALDPYASSGVAQPPPPKTEKVVEDRTAISDYPGDFDKYSQEKFLSIYKQMERKDLVIPQSMRGRDVRIISEDILIPKMIASDDEDEAQERKRNRNNRKRNTKRRRGRGRGRGRGGRGGRGRNREMAGMYYEDDMQYGNGGYYYDDYNYEYYGGQQGRYYDDQYYDEQYYEEEDTKRQSSRGASGKGRGRKKSARGTGRREDTTRKYNSRRQGGDVAKGKAKKAKPAKVWAPKGSAAAAEKSAKKKYPNYNKYKKANDDAPKVQKYSTKKGIYARKAVVAN